MKNYAHFLHLSTGYIEGTTPPQFSDKNRKPIEMVGSDARFPLDGRKSLGNWIIDAKTVASKRRSKIVGFTIYRNGIPTKTVML